MAKNLLKYAKELAAENNSNKLKNLSSLFFFTNRHNFKDIFRVIENLPQGASVIVREYDLNFSDRLAFAKKVKFLAKKKSLKFLIGKDLSLAIQVKADGVHFSDRDISWINFLRYQKTAPRNFIFTCSCHTISSLIKSEKLGFDAAFYSPIFPTKSHPEERAIGILKLATISHKIKIPIIALGGINDENVKLLKGCKISGIGGISGFEPSL